MQPTDAEGATVPAMSAMRLPRGTGMAPCYPIGWGAGGNPQGQVLLEPLLDRQSDDGRELAGSGCQRRQHQNPADVPAVDAQSSCKVGHRRVPARVEQLLPMVRP